MNTVRGYGTSFVKAFKGAYGHIATGQFDKMTSFADVNFPSIFSATTASIAAASRNTPWSGGLANFLKAQNETINISGVNRTVTDLLNSESPLDRALGEYHAFRNGLMGQVLTRGAVISKFDESHLLELGRVYEAKLAEAYKIRH